MAKPALHTPSPADSSALVERLRQAHKWAWHVFESRNPGVARDLAWALTGLARDHDPDTYVPWSRPRATEPAQLVQALELAGEIARAIRTADGLQPHLVRNGEVGR